MGLIKKIDALGKDVIPRLPCANKSSGNNVRNAGIAIGSFLGVGLIFCMQGGANEQPLDSISPSAVVGTVQVSDNKHLSYYPAVKSEFSSEFERITEIYFADALQKDKEWMQKSYPYDFLSQHTAGREIFQLYKTVLDRDPGHSAANFLYVRALWFYNSADIHTSWLANKGLEGSRQMNTFRTHNIQDMFPLSLVNAHRISCVKDEDGSYEENSFGDICLVSYDGMHLLDKVLKIRDLDNVLSEKVFWLDKLFKVTRGAEVFEPMDAAGYIFHAKTSLLREGPLKRTDYFAGVKDDRRLALMGYLHRALQLDQDNKEASELLGKLEREEDFTNVSIDLFPGVCE